jgi:parallel beta-helix repeat protein
MSQTLYVATNGSDLNAGTLENPFQTVQAALSTLNVNPNNNGGSIIIRSGSYSLDAPVFVSAKEGGNPNSRLVIRNFEGEKVIFDGSKLAADRKASFILTSTQDVDIQGLEIFGSYDGISVLGDSQDINIRNNIVHDVQFAGIAAFAAEQKGIRNVQIDGNTVYRTNLFNRDRPIEQNPGWASGIVFSRTEGGAVTNNTVYENYGEGIAFTLANGGVASNNTVYDNFSVGLYLDNATNTTLERNLVYSTGNQNFYRRFAGGTNGEIVEQAAVSIQFANETYADSNPLNNNVVRNNIIIGGDRVIGYGSYEQGGGLKNTTISNNTIYGNSTTQSIIAIDPDNHVNTQIFNNIIYQENAGQIGKYPTNLSGLSFDRNLWFGGSAGRAASVTDVNANPLLANPGGLSAQDYQIAASSPAIDVGLGSSLIFQDFLGRARPSGNGIDLGAFEVIGGNPPVALPPAPETPIAPVAVTPEPVTPEAPIAPPVTPNPVTPEAPIVPVAITPEPVTPETPIVPVAVTPEPVTPEAPIVVHPVPLVPAHPAPSIQPTPIQPTPIQPESICLPVEVCRPAKPQKPSPRSKRNPGKQRLNLDLSKLCYS